MSGLTIHGAHGLDVWLETEGDLYCLTARDLAAMRSEAEHVGSANRWDVLFDESDVLALIAALEGPQIDDCHHCDQPGLFVVEGRGLCPGHTAAFGAAEDDSMEAAR